VFKVEDFYNNSEIIEKELIEKNMIFTKEYYNVLKINFNEVIKKSENRKKTLNNIIKQLQIRYKNANTNIINLNKQRELLIGEYERIILKTQNLKRNLEKDFSKSNTKKVLEHTNDYYKLKYKEVNLKTNIVFLREFLKRYNFLNKRNKLLLDTLINNKDIISKNSYIVIPSSGSNLLKDFNILFTEEEHKQRIKKQ
jgi:vancomycin resistance protein YoaR